MSSRLELEAEIYAKGLALVEGVHEEEPELFFRGGKEEQQKFCKTTLAKDQMEGDPV